MLRPGAALPSTAESPAGPPQSLLSGHPGVMHTTCRQTYPRQLSLADVMLGMIQLRRKPTGREEGGEGGGVGSEPGGFPAGLCTAAEAFQFFRSGDHIRGGLHVLKAQILRPTRRAREPHGGADIKGMGGRFRMQLGGQKSKGFCLCSERSLERDPSAMHGPRRSVTGKREASVEATLEEDGEGGRVAGEVEDEAETGGGGGGGEMA